MHLVALKNKVKLLIQRITGLNISRHRTDFETTRNSLIQKLQPDLVIDCGANSGQWGSSLKKKFPHIDLISFEPLSTAFQALQLKSESFNSWATHQLALSSYSGIATIQVASNDGMSSSLSRPSLHVDVHPEIRFTDGQEIVVSTLDAFSFPAERIFLKLDVQGHEQSVLKGAVESIKSVVLIEIESSFTPLYESETPHHALIARLSSLGFIPFDFGNVHRDLDGRVWQLDTLLVREGCL
jgi:FkbM family methyltransferase